MDTVTLVEAQIEDGQRLLDRLAAEDFDIRGACWTRLVDDDRWSLYIATPAVDVSGPVPAYRQVYRVLSSLEDACITDSQVTLVGQKHPIVQEVLDRQQRLPGRMSARSQRLLLGGVPVEEIYAYPLGKVKVPIYGMVFEGEPTGALHLSFKPHNPDSRLIVGTEEDRHEYPAKTGIDWVVAAPAGVKQERDELGRILLAWDMHGRQMKSDANEVWSFAKLGMHGFRFLKEPPNGRLAQE